MGLREFIKEKIEVENLYDYEIAAIINADSVLVGRLRKNFGIKKAVVFPRQFERNYGEGAVEKFKKIIEKPDKSLADVARHLGFAENTHARRIRKSTDAPILKPTGANWWKESRGCLTAG